MAFTRRAFARTVLQRVGVRPTDGAMQAMLGWMQAEGGHFHNQARFNPLNTTEAAKGAGNTGSQGNIKVYRSPKQGVRATVRTLENGRYDGILSALKHGNASQAASAIDASPWGTHGPLVYSTIGAAPKHAGGGSNLIGSVKASQSTASAPGTSVGASTPSAGSPVADALLARLQTPRAAPQSMGLQAPSFSAAAKLPSGYASVSSAGAPASAPSTSVKDLLAMAAQITGQQSGSSPAASSSSPAPKSATPVKGGKVKAAEHGSPIPGEAPHSATHDTAGLAGYPAFDYMAKPGTTVVSPVNGKIVRFSGRDPKDGAYEGAGGPLGWSLYIQAENGHTYYLTHMGSRGVKVGQTVRAGQKIGTVANYDKYGRPSHIHMGVH